MNDCITFETPISSLKRLLINDNSDEFNLFVTFTNASRKNSKPAQVLNKKLIKTTINRARVISKKINRIYQIDPTIYEFNLVIPILCHHSTSALEKEIFMNEVEKLIRLLLKSAEEKIEVSNNKKDIFNIIRSLLGNDENEEIEFKISTDEEALFYLSTDFHDESIDFISSNFLNFVKKRKYKNVDEIIMKEIIDCYFSLKKTKNGVTEINDIFYKLISDGEDSSIILYYLMNLTFEEYNDDMLEYIFDHFDDKTIKCDLAQIVFIIRKFILKKMNEGKNDINTINCEYKGNELSGIIFYLTKNKSDSQIIKNEIKISGGGEFCPSFPILNLIKYDSKHINDHYYNSSSHFPTSDKSWIEFDFCDKKVRISSYTIRSNGGKPYLYPHPKTWIIFGSNDCKKWELIDKQKDNNVLNGIYKQNRFKCENNNNYYRFIRYFQEDSWDNDRRYQYVISLTSIEFFGTILKTTYKFENQNKFYY